MQEFTLCKQHSDLWSIDILRLFSIDLSLPTNGSIDRDSPAWSTNILDQYIDTINVFSKYDNVLAYNVGNEVVTASNETDATAFIKAAARDIKAYLCVSMCPGCRGCSQR